VPRKLAVKTDKTQVIHRVLISTNKKLYILQREELRAQAQLPFQQQAPNHSPDFFCSPKDTGFDGTLLLAIAPVAGLDGIAAAEHYEKQKRVSISSKNIALLANDLCFESIYFAAGNPSFSLVLLPTNKEHQA